MGAENKVYRCKNPERCSPGSVRVGVPLVLVSPPPQSPKKTPSGTTVDMWNASHGYAEKSSSVLGHSEQSLAFITSTRMLYDNMLLR